MMRWWDNFSIFKARVCVLQQGNVVPLFETREQSTRICTQTTREHFVPLFSPCFSNKVKTREVLHVKTRWKLFTLFFWNKVKTFHLVWQTRWKRFTLFVKQGENFSPCLKQGEKVSPCFIPLIYLNFIPSPVIIISPSCYVPPKVFHLF